MSPVLRTVLEAPAGYASREVARFMWQLDEQRARLLEDIAELAPGDLAWQIAPGSNTAGMLLAHIAWTETHLAQVGLLGEAKGHAWEVLGIAESDTGVPLPPGGAPPAAMAGHTVAFYRELLLRARDHTHRVARSLTDADLEVEISRPPRPDGTIRVFNKAWVLYHVLEHEAGHRAQILLLRHLSRDLAR